MIDSRPPLGWIGIVRLGLVQTALGAIVVLTTSTLNRVMVVELALPAMLPGVLVALHYAVQVLRPRLGYGSDVGGRRTPWIVGGMAVLAVGGVAAAVATAWMATNAAAGIVLAAAAFLLIGAGVGASGTSLLVLLAKRVDAARRPAAATIVWVMMIAGFIVTAGVAGALLDPFSPARLVAVTAGVSGIAFVMTLAAIWNVEGPRTVTPAQVPQPQTSFRAALTEVWAEPESRRFTVFVFVSMLAYSAQDLILEPFAGSVFGLTPGQSTQLAGVQHAGVLAGMLLVACAGTGIGGPRWGSMRLWSIGGCIASALALLALAAAGFTGIVLLLRIAVFALGVANGAFAVSAIGSMMNLVGRGRESREGVRMGLWGAAQAIAFGLGGFAGTLASDVARFVIGAPVKAYATVFTGEALLFAVAAVLAARAIGVTAAESAAAARATVSAPIRAATLGRLGQ
jgi:BCD family chlorophyll transporter-like MFS transporter